MKYSFVLPAYKARFFKEALDSILSQTYKDFELIIVNDASPEDITSIVKGYNDPRISYYINEVNIGGKDLVAQWNHCLEYATGDYVILASDDDIYHVEYLRKMDYLINKYPHISIFRPRTQIVDLIGSVIHIHGYLKENVSAAEFAYYWMRGHIGSAVSHYIFKKESLISIGGFINFPMAWGSDDATALELSLGGLVFHNEILFSFRQSGINISSQKNGAKSLKKKICAYNFFVKWLDQFVVKIQSTNIEDDFYCRYLKKNLPKFINYNLQIILTSSTWIAIIYNIGYLHELKWVRYSTCIRSMLVLMKNNFKNIKMFYKIKLR